MCNDAWPIHMHWLFLFDFSFSDLTGYMLMLTLSML